MAFGNISKGKLVLHYTVIVIVIVIGLCSRPVLVWFQPKTFGNFSHLLRSCVWEYLWIECSSFPDAHDKRIGTASFFLRAVAVAPRTVCHA